MVLTVGKRILPVIAGLVMIASCSSSKNATVAQRDDLKGTWTLDRITYEGLSNGESLRLTLLGEGDEVCLTGSTWVLPNNGYGTYTIGSGKSNCTPGERSIVWSYQKENSQPIFQFKRLPGGVKAKDIEEGYKFRITAAGNGAMTLQSEISFQGHPVFINYLFSEK